MRRPQHQRGRQRPRPRPLNHHRSADLGRFHTPPLPPPLPSRPSGLLRWRAPSASDRFWPTVDRRSWAFHARRPSGTVSGLAWAPATADRRLEDVGRMKSGLPRGRRSRPALSGRLAALLVRPLPLDRGGFPAAAAVRALPARGLAAAGGAVRGRALRPEPPAAAGRVGAGQRAAEAAARGPALRRPGPVRGPAERPGGGRPADPVHRQRLPHE